MSGRRERERERHTKRADRWRVMGGEAGRKGGNLIDPFHLHGRLKFFHLQFYKSLLFVFNVFMLVMKTIFCQQNPLKDSITQSVAEKKVFQLYSGVETTCTCVPPSWRFISGEVHPNYKKTYFPPNRGFNVQASWLLISVGRRYSDLLLK